jgi:hypothetical protein
MKTEHRISGQTSVSWQFSIRELLAVTAFVAVITTFGMTFGWLSVAVVVLHPLSLFVYVAVLFERRIRKRRNAEIVVSR